MDKETKRELIIEHYQNPYNRGLIDDDSYIKANTKSDSCIDQIEVMIKVKDNIIKDILFDGEACAICTSATSMIIKNINGKTIKEAKNILTNYKNMVNEVDYDKEILHELLAYEDIYLQPSRKKCCLLPSKTIDKILNSIDGEICK